MAFRKTLPADSEAYQAPVKESPNATPRTALRALPGAISFSPSGTHRSAEVHQALKNFHLLLRSERLYEKDHPQRLDSLDSAYDTIRNAAELLGGLEIRI